MMIIGRVIGYCLIILVSLVIFSIASNSRETKSWWVGRLREMAHRIKKTNPIKLGLLFFLMILLELSIILWIAVRAPWVIKGLYIFATFSTAFVVITLWLDNLMGKWGKYWLIIRLVVSALIAVSWLIFPDWVVYDIIGFIGGIAFLSLFPSLTFKQMLFIGAAMVTYDILGVYITGWIVQLVSSIGFMPPAVVIIPQAVSAGAPNLMMIGLGDIITGGVMISMAKQYHAEKWAFLAYCLAIAAAYVVAVLTNHGVPATMYIIPMMLGTVYLYRRSHGVLLSATE